MMMMSKILIIFKLRIRLTERLRIRIRSINLLSITFHQSPILLKTCSSRARLIIPCWTRWKMTVLQTLMLPLCRIAWSHLLDRSVASLQAPKSNARTLLLLSILTTMRSLATKSLTRTTTLSTTFWPYYWALTIKSILRMKNHPPRLSNQPRRWMLIKTFFRELTLRRLNTLLLLRVTKYLLSSELSDWMACTYHPECLLILRLSCILEV